MEILGALGIDWKLLIAQIINFIVLMAVLYKFLYKPIVRALESREKKIASSLKKVDAIEESWKDAQKKEEKLLGEARVKAQEILKEAKVLAEQENARCKEKTKRDIEILVNEAKQHIASEKEKAAETLRRETIELIIRASKKVLGKQDAKEINKELADEVLKSL